MIMTTTELLDSLLDEKGNFSFDPWRNTTCEDYKKLFDEEGCAILRPLEIEDYINSHNFPIKSDICKYYYAMNISSITSFNYMDNSAWRYC